MRIILIFMLFALLVASCTQQEQLPVPSYVPEPVVESLVAASQNASEDMGENTTAENPAPGETIGIVTETVTVTQGKSIALFADRQPSHTIFFQMGNGSALFAIDGRNVTLAQGRNVSVGNLTVRLDTLGQIREPRASSVDFSLGTPQGGIRSTVNEGSLLENGLMNVTLLFVGDGANGVAAAKFSVDGRELKPLAEKEETYFSGGWLYVHHIYAAKPGSTITLAQATITAALRIE